METEEMEAIEKIVCKYRSDIQAEVSTAVAERGYHDGWTEEQFLARQLAKLLEELAEMAAHLHLDPGQELRDILQEAGQLARALFDDPAVWRLSGTIHGARSVEELKNELADVQVVVYCMAESLVRLSGEPYDVVQAARMKGWADRERGVRK